MDKLQELTDKLYNEGLSKGKQEGMMILAKAHDEAEAVLAKAKAEAQAIIDLANAKAAEIAQKADSDLKKASAEAIAATRHDIENLITAKMVEPAGKSLADADFLKQVIKAVAAGFTKDEPVDIELVLPEALKAQLEGFVSTELSTALKSGVSASFSKKIAGGFNIGPKDGGWFISLTDETFKELIGSYLRPATKKILFG
ncbi:MAG: V-type ATP synthase subunit E [Bacteroidales bacterium]|nr:V-type ATP synthase subunit E [Bacteroidales bacterium]